MMRSTLPSTQKKRAISIVVAIAIAVAICGGIWGGNVALAYNDFTASIRVTADVASGAYTSPQSITLSAGDPDAVIYYTTDGTVPSAQNGTVYTAPIAVGEKGTTTRQNIYAVAYKNGKYSEVECFSYDILADVSKNKTVELQNFRTTIAPADNVECYVVDNYSGGSAKTEDWQAAFVDGKLKECQSSRSLYNAADRLGEVIIDLGETVTVNRFWLQTSGFGGSTADTDATTISCSTDGTQYETVYSTDRLPLNAPTGLKDAFGNASYYADQTFAPTAARYVKISKGTADKGTGYTSFMLFQGDFAYPEEIAAGTSVLDNATLTIENSVPFEEGKNVQIYEGTWAFLTDAEYAARLFDKAFKDGGQCLRYKNQPVGSGKTYLKIDLGKVYTVDRFHVQKSVHFNDEGVSNLHIEGSTDGVTWFDFYYKEGQTENNASEHVIWNDCNYADIKCNAADMRYVRISAGEQTEDGKDTYVHFSTFHMYAAAPVSAHRAVLRVPDPIRLSYDEEKTYDELTTALETDHGTVEFADGNGNKYTYAVAWEAEGFAAEDVPYGGTLTFAGKITDTVTGVDNLYDVAAIAEITLPKKTDTRALAAYAATLDSLVESDYTSSTWARYHTSRTAADAMLASPDEYTQVQIDEQLRLLRLDAEALAELGTKTDLSAYIAQVKDTAQGTFTEASYAVFTKALQDAQAAEASDDVTQEDVDAALTTLRSAFENLVDAKTLNELIAYIATVKAQVQAKSAYTAASWQAYETSLAAAETAAEESAEETALIAAKTALETAFAGLVLRGDKTALRAAYADAEKIDLTRYTAVTANAVRDAMDEAADALADEDATESMLTQAKTALETAVGALVALGDKTALSAKIDACRAKQAVSTATSWAKFEPTLQSAVATLENTQATQADVNAALDALVEAEKLLEGEVDKTALRAVLATEIHAEEYTALSMLGYTAARMHALAIDADKDATAEEVSKAAAKLTEAISLLRKLGDKTKLQTVVDAAQKALEGKYTAASAAALEEALTQAKLVLADSQADEEKVDNATKSVQDAQSSLVAERKKGCGGEMRGIASVWAGIVLAALGIAALGSKRVGSKEEK